jgi:hypothetical protein
MEGERRAFLTEPLDNHGWEWRCYMRDPDGYIIEVEQYSESPIKVFAERNAWVGRRKNSGAGPHAVTHTRTVHRRKSLQ